MPTSTFFNLPKEKRDKLLDAAWAEFARVPFSDASINRIIHAANIPRGSFYMYFQDKEDLFFFLLQEGKAWLGATMEQILVEHRGDLFAAFLSLYDLVAQKDFFQGKGDFFPRVAALFKHNMSMLASGVHQPFLPHELLPFFSEHIDLSLLSLNHEGDLQAVLHILFSVSGGPFFFAARGEHPQAARAWYANMLNLLRRGLCAQQGPAAI